MNINYFLNLLQKLQHRGHESFGISYIDNNHINTKKYLGFIKDNLDSINFNINSQIFTGHIRYSTSGNSKTDNKQKIEEAQPLNGYNKLLGEFSLSHNGNIPNLATNSSDTKYLLNLINNSNYDSILDLLKYIIENIDRAFNLIITTRDTIYILKDRYNTRPMCLGKNNVSYCVSSESCALINYELVREIDSGEIISINKYGIKELYKSDNISEAKCLFEFIYFLKGTSKINNLNINTFRFKTGKILAEIDKNSDFNTEDLIVVGAPETGIPSDEGYAKFLNLQYCQVLKKNKKINRTFILESNSKRDEISKQKYYIDHNFDISDKRILLTDDSLVRGITLKNIVKKFRDNHVKEIHIRIAAPAIYNPCFYGIDIPKKEELIVNNIDLNDLSTYFNCDSIKYTPLEEITKIISEKNTFCSGCFNGKYSNLEW